jgi:Zn-dependent M28 family amino/carboxypeptidase
MTRTIIFFTILFICPSCYSDKADYKKSVKSITTGDLASWVAELGSDSFMGRKPFTEGEKITVDYLAAQLEKIGFEPAFNGSYFQKVPMVEISTSVDEMIIAKNPKTIFRFRTPDEVAIVSPLETKSVFVSDMPLVFAGFGIVAPEYGWNDYSDLDVKGKIVVVMINDPGLYTRDSTLFRGREMTYYGRWTYKYEEAARQGAAGVMIIHETEGAGYEYTIPRKSSISPKLYMRDYSKNYPVCSFTGWFSSKSAGRLLASCGLDTDSLRLEACKKGFKGFPLNVTGSVSCHNEIRYDESSNVAGILKGSENPDECIIYTAHWDHFGIGEKENGDSIYNGAVDNGTTMAWELSAGKAFSSLRKRPARSIILLFPTAEEQGLIGSQYYTEHPVIPMEKTVACLNNDLLLPVGRMKDVMITGLGQSELDDYAARAAKKQDRYIAGDPNAHTGMYFRSDHFAFAGKGVPSLYARGSIESRKSGRQWASEQERDYILNRYHRPSDNYEPEKWNFEGIREDAILAFTIGYELSTSDVFPQWKSGSEFKQLRNK